jgi:hypothetical protein
MMRLLAFAIHWLRNGGFRKPPSPHIATVEALPGKTTLTLTHNGQAFSVLVLDTISTNGYDGTTATFVSLIKYMESNGVR